MKSPGLSCDPRQYDELGSILDGGGSGGVSSPAMMNIKKNLA